MSIVNPAGPPPVKRTLLIDREDYERFQRRHPQHGAFTWFVREVLRAYNELNDTDPDELIKLAAQEITTKT